MVGDSLNFILIINGSKNFLSSINSKDKIKGITNYGETK